MPSTSLTIICIIMRTAIGGIRVCSFLCAEIIDGHPGAAALCEEPSACGNFTRLHPGCAIHPLTSEGSMGIPSTREITQLLVAWNQGNAAALEQLTPLVQAELHRLAKRYMAGERRGHILQTTALVNEAYLRLIDWRNVEWQNRAHFFGLAAQLMRRILVDFARAYQSEKRGGGEIRVSLSEAANVPTERRPHLVALDDALQSLEKLDRRQARVVELRFFAGLSMEETAEALKVSLSTVRRDWSLAEAWLYRELNKTVQ